MIKRFDGEFAPRGVYGARVLAAFRSYFDMPECQFWVQDNTTVLSLVDGFAILSAQENTDWEELAAFLRMQPWSRLQCSADVAEKLPFPVEWRSMVLRFAAPKKEFTHDGISVAHDPGDPPCKACGLCRDPGEVYDVLARCGLGVKKRNDWMADLALRWRRGTAQTWMLGGVCTGSAVAVTPGHIYIGALGTLPEHRGRGLAGQLISHICGQYAGREVWLSCREELQGFYESIGFERVGDMITLQKENT